MRTDHKTRLQMLRRVRDFLQPLADDPALAASISELDGVIERMTVHMRRQDMQDRQTKFGTESIAILTRNLRDDLLRPVTLLVRTIIPDGVPQVPGKGALSVPRGRDREGLITAAKGFHDAALPYEAPLVAAGLPRGHLAKLIEGAEALRAAVDGRAQAYLLRAASRATAAAEAKRATTLVRLIDSLVRPRFRGNPGELAAWDQARRTVRLSVSSSASPVAAPEGATSVTSPGVVVERIAEAQVRAA